MTLLFAIAVLLASVFAGGVAAIAGFGIGSLLTPLLAMRLPMDLAVAAVAWPHLLATSMRLWMLRRKIDWKVLGTFGVVSAVAAWAGALLQATTGSHGLGWLLGALLIIVGILGLLGITARWKLHGAAAWCAGAVSGGLGGLVGNQGGIRSAALLGFNLTQEAFVATSTAVGVLVDLARLPVYSSRAATAPLHLAIWMLPAAIGVTIGTLAGRRLLARIPRRTFFRVIDAILIVVGVSLCLPL